MTNYEMAQDALQTSVIAGHSRSLECATRAQVSATLAIVDMLKCYTDQLILLNKNLVEVTKAIGYLGYH